MYVHITSGSGIKKFQADGFLLDIVYNGPATCAVWDCYQQGSIYSLHILHSYGVSVSCVDKGTQLPRF